MAMAHDLQKVSHHVDWEKLHDEYLMAIYSEEPSGRRKLKRRGSRPRHKGQRKKDWNLAAIEENLEKEATQAIEEARGFRTPGIANSDAPQKVNETSSIPEPTPDKTGAQDLASTAVEPVASIDAASGAGDNPAADGDEFPITVNSTKLHALTTGTVKDAKDTVRSSVRQGNDPSFNGKPIPVYTPSKGNCPGVGNIAVNPIPCAPDNLNDICNKYNDAGSFKLCFEACKPSFCCIHGKQHCATELIDETR